MAWSEFPRCSDYTNISQTIIRLFVAADNHDWAAIEQLFAPTVVMDYSSMNGQGPMTLTPNEITTAWKALLPGFAFTEHVVSNFLVQEVNEERTDYIATCYGVAGHYLPVEDQQSSWVVHGTYEFGLQENGLSFRITRMKFNLRFVEGNPALASAAVERAAALLQREKAP